MWFLNLSLLGIGLVSRPRTAFPAFARGRRALSIYHDPPQAVTLATTTVGEMRRRLRLDVAAQPIDWRDYAGYVAWGMAGLLTLVLPVLAVLALSWLGVRALSS